MAPPQTTDEATQVLNKAIDVYTKFRTCDEDLWDSFRENFNDWTEDHFNKIEKFDLIAFRDFLYQRGVVVRKQSGYPVARALQKS